MHRSARMILAAVVAASVLAAPSTLAAATRSVKASGAGCTVTVNQLKLVSQPRFDWLEEFGSVSCSRTQRVSLKVEIDYFVPNVWPGSFTDFPPYKVNAGRVDRFRFRAPCNLRLRVRVGATLTLHPRGHPVEHIRTPFLYHMFDCPSVT